MRWYNLVVNETENVPYDTIGTASSASAVTLNGEQISYHLVEASAQVNSGLAVEVENPTNQEEINQAIVDRLQQSYWFLSPEYASQTVRQRFDVELAEGVNVGIYNFQERDLLPEEIEILGGSLMKYYSRLKDKGLWTLDSIQIEREDLQNPKSGKPYRGMEVPPQRRFKLFPASFTEGRYRDAIDCSWLEGSVGHETTHVTVEPALQPIWGQQAEALGWRDAEDALIELPGGATTRRYNEHPSNIATAYGSYQEDDDRAESVVQWLAEPAKVEATRASILSQFFNEPPSEIGLPTVTPRTAEIPKLDTVNVLVKKKPEFTITGVVRRQGQPKPIVPLATFRQQHGIV